MRDQMFTFAFGQRVTHREAPRDDAGSVAVEMVITHQGFDHRGEIYSAEWWTPDGSHHSRWFAPSELVAL